MRFCPTSRKSGNATGTTDVKRVLSAGLLVAIQILRGAELPAAGRYDDLPDRAFGVHCLFRVYPAVSEASGAALVTDTNGAVSYWSHGDSGTGTVLGRTDMVSLKTERIQLAGRAGGQPVENADWESLSPDPDGNLWIVDGGGNNFDRHFIVSYKINPRDPTRPLPVLRRITVDYPPHPPATKTPDADSPERWGPDVEASIVFDGSLFLIEKTVLDTPRIYQVNLASVPSNAITARIPARQIGVLSQTAQKGTAQIPISLVTDASMCGTNVYLLTYYGVFCLPVAEFTKAAKSPAAETVIGRDNLQFLFSIVGIPNFLVQAEGLVAISHDQFLISREDGRVFCWRNGHFEEPPPRRAGLPLPAAAGK